MNIDPKEIDEIKDPHERADFIVLLKNLLDYALASFGMSEPPGPPPLQSHSEDQESDPPTVPPPDPVGDVVILDHKLQQLKAGLPRKSSGWMSVGFPNKIDDKHI